jgi:predicted Fe-S protein YdhL (DUF1289 family)
MSTSPKLNLADMRRRKPDQRVPSPCISVCELDEQRSRCKGCHRTLDELRAWGAMTDDEKLVVWASIEARQAGATV